MKQEPITERRIDKIATTLGGYAFAIASRKTLSTVIESPKVRRSLIQFIEASLVLSKAGLPRSQYKSIDQLGESIQSELVEALKAVSNPKVRKQVKQALTKKL